MQSMPPMKLSKIHRYPLKSCAGQSLTEAMLETLGIEGDRRLILSDTNGRFITARTEPKLLQVSFTLQANGWCATHPELGSCSIEPSSAFSAEVEVWGRTIRAARLKAAEAWFTELLGRTVHLLLNQDATDLGEKRYPWGPIFSDGYPLLICNSASLDAVNQASGGQYEMSRFRANLVIDADLPWIEDGWELIEIGSARLRRCKPCERCVLITRDPLTGEKDPSQEPLRTLAQLHTGPNGEVLFGQNFSVERAGVVAVGDFVRLL